MRFYKNQHTYYCDIDLHSKVIYVCVMDQAGTVLVHRNIPAEPQRLLELLEPYRNGVVVGVECMYCWYWLADLCADEGIPKEMRGTRDLMRRRSFFVRKRSELYAHVQMTYHQHNFENPGQKLAYRGNREKLEKPFKDDSTLRAVDADLVLIEHYSSLIRSLEYYIENLTRRNSPHSVNLALLKTIPGIGSVLASTILYEIDDIKRFPSVQHFASYARLIKPKKTSAGKTTGGGGGKIGNQHLKWAFSEASVLFLRCDAGKRYYQQLQKKHSKAKCLSVIAHKLGRAVYFMLLRQKAWSEEKLLMAA